MFTEKYVTLFPESLSELCFEIHPNRHRVTHELRKNFGNRPTSVGPRVTRGSRPSGGPSTMKVRAEHYVVMGGHHLSRLPSGSLTNYTTGMRNTFESNEYPGKESILNFFPRSMARSPIRSTAKPVVPPIYANT